MWLTGPPSSIPRPIPRDLHAFLRNHIIISFVIGNAVRSGGISELTVQQFRDAEHFPEIDQHVMKVHQSFHTIISFIRIQDYQYFYSISILPTYAKSVSVLPYIF